MALLKETVGGQRHGYKVSARFLEPDGPLEHVSCDYPRSVACCGRFGPSRYCILVDVICNAIEERRVDPMPEWTLAAVGGVYV